MAVTGGASNGQAAVVTGGAHGIGRAVARRLAVEGASVAIVDIDGASASAVVAELSPGDGRHLAVKADVEYAPEVRVNAVSPGYVATRMTAAVLDDPNLRSRIESRIPLGRIGDAEEVAGGVAFLCSADAAFVTGHDLVIDGGGLLPSHQSDELLKSLLDRWE
jgi:NAD(P)-dependent dehydrogenase (short-subunit alcohol dehydrogenase family)